MKKTVFISLLATVAISTSVSALATTFTTDDARAEVARRHAEAQRVAALQPVELQGVQEIRVTDTESARAAAAQTTARHVRERHRAQVLRAGAGIKPAPIQVTDTDSARAAAAQQHLEQSLLADHADCVKLQAQSALAPVDAAKQ